MSTQSVSGAGSLSQTSSLTGGSLLQITGLASGLDTNSIIASLLAIDRQPVTSLTNKQKALQALNTQLTSIQSTLQQVAANAQALGSSSLFDTSQTVTSSDPTKISASTTSGAGVGSYEVGVTQLATSSQKTFLYNSPAQQDNITIDGQAVSVAAGESIHDFVASINSNSNLDVYAAAPDGQHVIFSTKATGQTTDPSNPDLGTFINITDTGGTFDPNNPTAYRLGRDAQYTVDAGSTQTSHSNTVASAIPGVSLTFNAITTTSGPVTVSIDPPAPNTASIQAAVKTFVDSYNAMIDQVNTQLTQKTSRGDPTVGTLFGDSELSGLLSNMREAMYTPDPSLSGSIKSLTDIGISTGASTGSGTFSQDAVDGKLTIDSTALANAIQSNPGAVQSLLQQWSQSFSTLVNNEAQPGGSLDARIHGDSSEISDIGDQITNLNAILADKQTALQQQFASLEATLSRNQSQSSWLAGQIASLRVG